MAAQGLPTKGASNQASSLTIVLSATGSAHVFTDDDVASKFLVTNQPIIRSVCQVPLGIGVPTRTN